MADTAVGTHIILPTAITYDILAKKILAEIFIWHTLSVNDCAGDEVTEALIFVLADNLAGAHIWTHLSIENACHWDARTVVCLEKILRANTASCSRRLVSDALAKVAANSIVDDTRRRIARPVQEGFSIRTSDDLVLTIATAISFFTPATIIAACPVIRAYLMGPSPAVQWVAIAVFKECALRAGASRSRKRGVFVATSQVVTY